MRRSLQASQEAVENALCDLFMTSAAEVEDGLKNAPYNFKETVLTNMADKGALNEIFGRRIDRWTQSTSFMDAFISRVQVFLRFMRPNPQS